MESKYFRYAFGEIVLVVAGILIALSINNWNEQRKYERYEILLLNEIHDSLQRDRERIDSFFLTRLRRKESSVAQLTKLAGERTQISDRQFLDLYSQMSVDFLFRFDSAAYDALKTSGFDKLSNDSLRAQLITTYDVNLPAFSRFIEGVNEQNDPIITQLSFDIISEKFTKNETDEWEIEPDVIIDNVIEHPSFLRILRLESQKARNQGRRLTTIIQFYDELIAQVASELNARK